MLVAGGDFAGGESGGAVGEGGAVLDEGTVGRGVRGDEDGEAGAEAKGNDWAVDKAEVVAEEAFNVGEGVPEH